jgi:hypothetical protein
VAYKLILQPRPAYLHALVTGENTRENVAGYLGELHRECDLFAIVMEESDRARGVFQAIAYVDVNAGGDMMKFAESVALSRGIPVRLFATVPDARKWLEQEAAREQG